MWWISRQTCKPLINSLSIAQIFKHLYSHTLSFIYYSSAYCIKSLPYIPSFTDMHCTPSCLFVECFVAFSTLLFNTSTYIFLPVIPYSRKLSREKTFANFVVLWLFAKVFFTKFGGMASVGVAKASNPQKFSLRKPYFTKFMKVFSLEIFSLHGMW